MGVNRIYDKNFRTNLFLLKLFCYISVYKNIWKNTQTPCLTNKPKAFWFDDMRRLVKHGKSSQTVCMWFID